MNALSRKESPASLCDSVINNAVTKYRIIAAKQAAGKFLSQNSTAVAQHAAATVN